MAATSDQIARVRRMVNELTTTTYSDIAIQAYIEAHPLPDENGTEPRVLDLSTTPPSYVYSTSWYPTYDLNAAAAEIWEEKAAALAAQVDFSADGGSYSQSQAHANALAMSRFYRARRSAKTVDVVVEG